jgi:hypothetical protein
MNTASSTPTIASIRSFDPASSRRFTQPVPAPSTPGVRPRGSDVVILSREATAQHARLSAQKPPAAVGKKTSPPPTAPAPAGDAPATQGTPKTFGQADLDAIRDAFGARLGDSNYSQDADTDGNGIIDFKDMTQVLSNWGQTKP